MTRLPEQPGGPRSMLHPKHSARASGEVASPHRAGHYSGLHPEDQPYQTDDVRDPRHAPRRLEPVPVDDEDEYEEGYAVDTGYDDPPRMPTSGRRYSPVQAASPRTVMRVQHYYSAVPPRASLTQTQDYHLPSEPEPKLEPRRKRPRAASRLHWLAYVGGAMFLMLIDWMALSEFANWWQTTQDTMHYGYPRTFQIDAVVGHADSTMHRKTGPGAS